MARGLGINVNAVFALTFAFGSGLAGLGGALGAEILGLDPTFPLKFMIYFLIVVTVGGTSSITGPFFASLLLGIADVAGKYYVPKLGAFVIYTHHDRGPDLAAAGLFARPQRAMSRCACDDIGHHAMRRARWHPAELAVLGSWRSATIFLFPQPLPDPHRDRHPRRCSRSRST